MFLDRPKIKASQGAMQEGPLSGVDKEKEEPWKEEVEICLNKLGN
jgi:hypothetical protein